MTVVDQDVIRVTAKMSRLGADNYDNVFHFLYDSIVPVSDPVFMDDVADLLDAKYSLINSNIASNVQYDLILGQNITQAVELPERTWPVLTVGGAVGDVLPNQDCAYVYWRTNRLRTRASKYLPPYTEAANIGNGTIAAIAQTNMQNFANAFLGVIVQGAISVRLGAYNQPLDRFSQVQIALIKGEFRTQRRRRTGVGA